MPSLKGAMLRAAAERGDQAGGDEALRRGDFLNSVDGQGRTPLMPAMLGGHARVAAHLAAAMDKEGLDLSDGEGATAAMRAARAGDAGSIRMLAKLGASLVRGGGKAPRH